MKFSKNAASTSSTGRRLNEQEAWRSLSPVTLDLCEFILCECVGSGVEDALTCPSNVRSMEYYAGI